MNEKKDFLDKEPAGKLPQLISSNKTLAVISGKDYVKKL